MIKLATEAGRAGINSTPPQKKLGLLASFVAAACMTLSGTCAWAAPEAKNTRTPATPEANTALKTAANGNFKKTGPESDPKWTIRLSGSIDQGMAERINDRLRALHKEDPTREITLIINSGGGSVPAALSIYDVMQSIDNDVRTVCESMAMSMGAILLAGGTPGKRDAYQNCEIMIHEPSSNIGGRLSNIKSWSEDINRANEILVEILHERTGLSKNDLRSMMIVDVVFTRAKDAKDMGLIDNVIPSKDIPPAAPRKIPESFCKSPDRQQLRVCPPAQKP